MRPSAPSIVAAFVITAALAPAHARPARQNAARQAGQTGQAGQPPPQFRAGTRTVPVYASVTDETGRFVLDLGKNDFEVRDNGKVQEITQFTTDIQPITAVVLLDASASMLSVLNAGIAAVNDFVVRMLPGDRARIGSFAERIDILPEFTGDRDALLDLFTNEFNIVVGRRTRLWDAIDGAVAALQGVEGRRVVVVISDGVDTWSEARFSDVLGHVRRSDVVFYGIEMRNPEREGQAVELSNGPDGSSPGRPSLPRNGFDLLAQETGGGHLSIDAYDRVHASFTGAMLELHSQYVIGFTPQVLDGQVHTIDVRMKRPGLKARARKSYVAAPDGS